MARDMKVHRPEPIRDQVARLLRTAIDEQHFTPGQVLIERELCETTGASRTSVREALRQLESEGLVNSVVGKGTVVSSVAEDEGRNIYAVRAVLEGLAGREFTLHATAEELAELHKTVDEFAEAIESGGDLVAIKDRFYTCLYSGAGNPVAHQVFEMLHRRISSLRRTTLAKPGRPPQTLRELREILAAIDAKEADKVEQLCREHVARAERAAFES